MLVLATLTILIAVLVLRFLLIKAVLGEKKYEVFLITVNTTQPEDLFGEYLKEYGEDVCPDGGDISYWDGEVKCSIHSLIDDGEGDSGSGDEDVPFL